MGCAEGSSLSPLIFFLEPPLGLVMSCLARVAPRLSVFWCFGDGVGAGVRKNS